MKKYLILLLILYLIANSCSECYHDDKCNLIKIKTQYFEHKKEILIIKDWIEKHTSHTPPYEINRQRNVPKAFVDYGLKNLPIYPDSTERIIYNFFVSGMKVYMLMVYEDIIEFRINRNNERERSFHLVYLRNTQTKRYEKHKYYETEQIPKEPGRWIYHIENKWYIISY